MDKDKMISHFGARFYAKVVSDLDQYSKLWGLSCFEQVDYYSVNCIFKCVSERYGLCILKIGNNANNTKSEYRLLREYEKSRFCAAYEADIDNGVLLLEQIVPGTQLRAVQDLEQRIALFCELFTGLHRKPADQAAYKTYMGWVSRITKYMSSQKDHELLYRKMRKAEEICRDLCGKYPGEMLLHGDLHHDNILLDGDNRYRVIDPKGVVGDRVFDIPRFILNEFEDEISADFENKFVLVVKSLSEKLVIPEDDIRRLTYVEMCMANCWSVESRKEPDMNSVLFTEKMMNGEP